MKVIDLAGPSSVRAGDRTRDRPVSKATNPFNFLNGTQEVGGVIPGMSGVSDALMVPGRCLFVCGLNV